MRIRETYSKLKEERLDQIESGCVFYRNNYKDLLYLLLDERDPDEEEYIMCADLKTGCIRRIKESELVVVVDGEFVRNT